jgi:hypothetical protein
LLKIDFYYINIYLYIYLMEFIGLPIVQDEFDFRFCDVYCINDKTFEKKEITNKKLDIDKK